MQREPAQDEQIVTKDAVYYFLVPTFLIVEVLHHQTDIPAISNRFLSNLLLSFPAGHTAFKQIWYTNTNAT